MSLSCFAKDRTIRHHDEAVGTGTLGRSDLPQTPGAVLHVQAAQWRHLVQRKIVH